MMSEQGTGLTPHQLRAVNGLAGAESNGSDVAGCESEAWPVAESGCRDRSGSAEPLLADLVASTSAVPERR